MWLTLGHLALQGLVAQLEVDDMMSRSSERKEIQLKASRENAGPVDPSDISDAMEDDGPARKVELGRPEPKGYDGEVEGSFMGDGEAGEASIRGSAIGKGGSEGPSRISGSHMGREAKGEKSGEGFDAEGSLEKEHGKIKNQP